MQQVFPCPRCGYQSAVGVRFCETCGTKFQYKCLRCDGIIDPTFRFCPDCCTKLEWPEPQNTQPIPMGQNTYYEPQSIYRYGRCEPQYKEKSSSPIKYLGLILGIVLIVAGGIFAANTGSSRPSLPIPPASSQLPAIPSPPKENKTGTGTLSDYVQQYTSRQPPYLRQSGVHIHLVNNPDSRNVSFADLKSFILQDMTDDEIYMPGVRICGDFAEMLHNNAEDKKIKAEWVGIDWENESVGHAINAFQTTDRGLVYIDCTGRGFRDAYEQRAYGKLDPCERDRVAYIEKGREYGVININKVESLNYTFYVEYAQNWQKFDSMMDAYNSEVDAFNRVYANKTTLPTSEYSKYVAWRAQLEGKERVLKELEEKLGNCFAKPLGIVKAVEIYW